MPNYFSDIVPKIFSQSIKRRIYLIIYEMSTTYIASVIASYWAVSISMVYLNKVLLSSPESSIAAPLFVTWYQCVITCVVCVILGNLGENTRTQKKSSFLNDFPVIRFDPKTCLAVLPLSLIFVGMITFNNICLQYVQVSFCKRLLLCLTMFCDICDRFCNDTTHLYTHNVCSFIDNVARSLSIVFNVIFTFLIMGKPTGMLTCSTLLIVIIGFYCGTWCLYLTSICMSCSIMLCI